MSYYPNERPERGKKPMQFRKVEGGLWECHCSTFYGYGLTVEEAWRSMVERVDAYRKWHADRQATWRFV